MAFDFSLISPQARADYIRIGRSFGSRDTLAQANDILHALETHGADLVPFGFSQGDAKQLIVLRNELEAAGVGRSLAEASKKTTSQTYLQAVGEGKQARMVARSVLSNIERALYQQGAPANELALRELRVVLGKTQSAGADDEALARQLELIADALRHPVIAAEGNERGARPALRDVELAIGRLREAARARISKPGTPAETEKLDLIDGLIVSLVRSARRAARLAAVRHGSPALAKAFELSKLYPSRSKGAETSSSEAAEAPPSTPSPDCG